MTTAIAAFLTTLSLLQAGSTLEKQQDVLGFVVWALVGAIGMGVITIPVITVF